MKIKTRGEIDIIAGMLKALVQLERDINRPLSPAEIAEIKRQDELAKAEVARINAENEFRQEVIQAMVDAGIARHVAANRTATEAKLLACAREFEII